MSAALPRGNIYFFCYETAAIPLLLFLPQCSSRHLYKPGSGNDTRKKVGDEYGQEYDTIKDIGLARY